MHVCGNCKQEFKTEAEYLDHTCPVTEFKPTEPENLGGDFAKIQEAAIERGEAKK